MRRINKQDRRLLFIAACWDVLWFVLFFIVLSFVVAQAKADCIVSFGAEWCGPCQKMRPIEDKLRQEGYDIRYVDINNQPFLKKAYRITRVPTVVYLIETPYGNYEGGRMVGLADEAQLRAFCSQRVVVPLANPVTNAIRCLLGAPIIIGY